MIWSSYSYNVYNNLLQCSIIVFSNGRIVDFWFFIWTLRSHPPLKIISAVRGSFSFIRHRSLVPLKRGDTPSSTRGHSKEDPARNASLSRKSFAPLKRSCTRSLTWGFSKEDSAFLYLFCSCEVSKPSKGFLWLLQLEALMSPALLLLLWFFFFKKVSFLNNSSPCAPLSPALCNSFWCFC